MMPKRVMVVDDNESNAGFCRDVLVGKEYEVECALNHDQAIRLISSAEFHLAVVNQSLRGKNGLETFVDLRKKNHDLVGILIVEGGSIDTAIEAMGLGVSGFLKRPFTADELAGIVENHLRKVALLEEDTRLATLVPLYKLGEKFITAQNRQEVLDELLKAVLRHTRAEAISVMLYDEKEKCLRVAAEIGLEEGIAEKVRIKPGEKIAGWVFENGEPVILNRGSEGQSRFAQYLKRAEIAAAMSFPLKAREGVLGVLNVSKLGKGFPYSQADIELLSVICSQAVMALEHVKILDERAEKVRMRTLFEQYVAPEVAEVLIANEQDLMDLGDIKEITIFFADIRNFTPLVRHLPLATIRSFLNDFFDIFSELIFKGKGILDKFMGDAALASFGALIPLREPNKVAVSAAIEIRRRFYDLMKKWTSTDQSFEQVGLGIGISCGEMFMGNVGSKKRLDYTVIGSDVNLAQRLASEAAAGEILLSKSVADSLGSAFRVSREQARLLRGLEKPIAVFSVATEQ